MWKEVGFFPFLFWQHSLCESDIWSMSGVCQSVVADIEHRSIFRYIFFSDYCDFSSSDTEDEAKYCLDDAEGTDIFCHGRKFTNDPFNQQNGYGENQISDHHDTDKNKSYHLLSGQMRNAHVMLMFFLLYGIMRYPARKNLMMPG